uniref:Putative secreted peptide n=1 Tax=Anopheles braziliensis TaxID=58242 RepID=A0A2M3ZN56_9DIPT
MATAGYCCPFLLLPSFRRAHCHKRIVGHQRCCWSFLSLLAHFVFAIVTTTTTTTTVQVMMEMMKVMMLSHQMPSNELHSLHVHRHRRNDVLQSTWRTLKSASLYHLAGVCQNRQWWSH